MASSQLSGPDENEDKPQWQTNAAKYFDKQFRNEIQSMENRMLEIIEAETSGNKNVDFNKDWQQDIEGSEEVNEELVEERKPSTEQKSRIRLNWKHKIGGKKVHIEELVQEAKHDVEFSQGWKTKLEGNELTFEERIEYPYSFDKDEEGYAAGVIRSMPFEAVSPVEIETNRGTLKQCTILVFAKKIYATFLSLWIEIVSIHKADEISKERENKHNMKAIPFCRSPVVFLYDTQRIRIDVSGNVKCIQTKEKIALTLTFLHTANDCYLSFPLEIYRRTNGVPYVMIDFINDSGKKRVVRRLHTAYFDPERVSATEPNTPRTFLYKSPPSQANQREQYHRTISAPEMDLQSHGLVSMKISKPNPHPQLETRPDDERKSTKNKGA